MRRIIWTNLVFICAHNSATGPRGVPGSHQPRPQPVVPSHSRLREGDERAASRGRLAVHSQRALQCFGGGVKKMRPNAATRKNLR